MTLKPRDGRRMKSARGRGALNVRPLGAASEFVVVKFQGLVNRLTPFARKLAGHLPLCPWSSVIEALHPATLSARPPIFAIQEVKRAEGMKCLKFDDQRLFWFPEETPVTPDLWSEYLCVFWSHPANGHLYLSPETPIASGDVCIDCGACEGFFAQQAFEFGAARVVCVEPSSQMIGCLEQTFRTFSAEGRAMLLNVAVGAIDGSCSFAFDRADPFSGRLSQDRSQQVVRIATIDTLTAELALEKVDYIKMDIEGAEIQALEGAMKTLERDHPKLSITTYHRAFDYAALSAFLKGLGYRHIRPQGISRRETSIYRPVMLHAWQ